MRPGPNWAPLLINRAKVQGFIISFHLDKLPQFFAEVGPLVAGGKVKYQETVVEGLANAPKAFMGLLRGENAGKMVVKL
jgi:NADPH-dependent curcumin reductase CurA